MAILASSGGLAAIVAAWLPWPYAPVKRTYDCDAA